MINVPCKKDSLPCTNDQSGTGEQPGTNEQTGKLSAAIPGDLSSSPAKGREARILSRFIGVYCRGHHNTRGKELCAECSGLLTYALDKLERCPYDPKPKCKACTTHCYKPAYREKIKEVMRYSGIHFVKRGRLDWLIRYFLA